MEGSTETSGALKTKAKSAEHVAAQLDPVFAVLRAGLDALKKPPAEARR